MITVPLYYTSKSIDSIKDVATKAGFNVIQVIDEPCAAALACGLGIEPEEPPWYAILVAFDFILTEFVPNKFIF